MRSLRRAASRQLIGRLGRDDNGAALVEYGMLIALLTVICLVAAQLLGQQLSGTFSYMAAQLSSSLAG